MSRVVLIFALVLAWAPALTAQTPEEMVRWVYMSEAAPGPAEQRGIWFLASPEQRGNYFTRRMVYFFDANDSYGDNLAEACIDFSPSIPGNDYDEAELVRTLTLTSQNRAEGVTVTASFTTFGYPASVSYDFLPEDGFWKIDDIVLNGHRMSDIPCEPKAAAAPTPVHAYCFRTGNEQALRLDLDGAGGARLEFWSWQSNGHACSGQPVGNEVSGGWRFPGNGACELQLQIASDGGVELRDPEWACKEYMCGQRAVIDQMRFPHSSRIDCGAWQSFGN